MTTTLRRKKRDMSQCVMSVLECLKDQQYDEGVMKQDLMYRCGLNFHYMEQIMNYLIVNGLTYKSSTQPSYRKNSFRYFLTEKGFKFWADLEQHLEPVGGIKWFKENIEKAAFEITMKIVLSWRYVKGTATFLVGKSSTSAINRSITPYPS